MYFVFFSVRVNAITAYVLVPRSVMSMVFVTTVTRFFLGHELQFPRVYLSR